MTSDPSGDPPSGEDAPPPAEQDLPEGISPPPPPKALPDPDPFDKPQPGHRVDGKKRRKGRKAKKEFHPTDHYQASQKMKTRKGCGGCLGSLILLVVILVASPAVFLVGPFLLQGYKTVYLGGDATIDTAPEVATLYIGGTVEYQPPLTDVKIAVVAKEASLSGAFTENTSVRAMTLVGKKGAIFVQDLEIFAIRFLDEGIQVDGELGGSVVNQ